MPLAQATVAVYLAGLAGAQLLWGELLNRLGPRRCMEVGLALLALTSLGCALAPGIEVLLVLRLLQGVAAAAATVVAPTVARATLGEADVVRGIAAISMVEAIVPAAGPVIGALLLQVTDWRGTFWVLALLSLLVLPWVVKIAPRRLPGLDMAHDAGYLGVLRNRVFVRLAASHALCIGALLTFLASAPQLLQHTLGRGTAAFALLQVLGVSAFMLGATQSGRLAARLGHARVVQWGCGVQLAVAAIALGVALLGQPPFCHRGWLLGLLLRRAGRPRAGHVRRCAGRAARADGPGDGAAGVGAAGGRCAGHAARRTVHGLCGQRRAAVRQRAADAAGQRGAGVALPGGAASGYGGHSGRSDLGTRPMARAGGRP